MDYLISQIHQERSMLKLLASWLLFSATSAVLIPSAQALTIYQTPYMGEADRRVAIVNDPLSADVWIYRSAVRDPSPYVWYIIRDREAAQASVYFTSIGFAQCLVYFVDRRSDAGQVRPNRRCFR